MATRHKNYRLVKIHRNYTVDEAAGLLETHKNTVRLWIKKGLPVCDDKRPTLILGLELKGFLEGQRKARKRRCKPDEMYCVRCREPKQPVDGMVDFEPFSESKGRLVGLCPICHSVMNRFASLASLTRIKAYLDVRIPKALEHISNSSELPLNSDFSK